MWHAIVNFIDWRSGFNAAFIGVGGISVWVFKFHYSRLMAAHDAQREADAQWRASVDSDIQELKLWADAQDTGYARDARHTGDEEADQKNGVDKQSDARRSRESRGNRGRLRDS